ncbi:MAG: LuxR C-terminal-related transcriptional regulator [Acidobacteriota bacterium]
MRIVLIGQSKARERLRLALLTSGLDVVDEADSMAAARDAGVETDAYLVAPPEQRNRRLTFPGELPEPLTPRELEVLLRLADGLANKSIAARLGISDQTVKVHVASICGKLRVPNRTAAVRVAIRLGLIAI